MFKHDPCREMHTFNGGGNLRDKVGAAMQPLNLKRTHFVFVIHLLQSTS